MHPKVELAGFEERRSLHEAPGVRVSCVEDRATGELRTLKVVRLEGGIDANAVVRELDLLLGLRHPRLTELLDFGRAEGAIWLLRRFVEGETLREAGPGLDPRERRGLLVDLLSALRYLHAHGVVHHDVKPENVLVERANGTLHAVLTDYGLAMRLGMERGSGVRGTPPFVAPEVLLGLPGDERLDLFSLAASLVSVDVSEERLALSSVYRRFPRESWLAATGAALDRFDDESAFWLRRMLATDPEDRPRGAASILATLCTGGESWSPAECRALLRPVADPERDGVSPVLRDWLAGDGGARALRIAVEPDAPVRALLERTRLSAIANGLAWVAEPPPIWSDDGSLGLRAGGGPRAAATVAALVASGPDTLVVVDLAAESTWDERVVGPLVDAVGRDRSGPRVLVLERPSIRGTGESAPRLRALTTDTLADHLVHLEGGEATAGRDRLRALADGLLAVAGADVERITDVLAAELDAGRILVRAEGLDLSGIDPAQLVPPVGLASRLGSCMPERIEALARLALVGGSLAERHAHRLYDDGEWARLRRDDGAAVRVAPDGTGCISLEPRSAAAVIVGVADRALLAAAAGRVRATERVFRTLGASRRALVHAALGEDDAAADEAERSADEGPAVAREPLTLAVELSRPGTAAHGRLVVALVRRLNEAGAYDESLHHLTRALESRPDRAVRCDLSILTGEVHLLRRRFDEAEAEFRRARRSLDPLDGGASPAAGDVARGLAFARFFRGDAVAATRVLERFMSARTAAGESSPAWATVLLGTFLLRAGEPERAREAFVEGLERARSEGGDDHLVAVAQTNLSTLLLRRGELAAAREALAEVGRLRRGVGRPHEEAVALNNLGLVEREDAAFDEAARCFAEAMRLYARIGDPVGVASAEANLASIDALRGDLTTASERLVRAIEQFGLRGAEVERRLAMARLTEVRLEAGEETGAAAAEEAPPGDRAAGECLLVEARRLEAAGDGGEALRHGQQAVDRLRRAGDRPGEGRASLLCARLCRGGGLLPAARRHLDACGRVATPRLDAARRLEEGRLVECEGGRDEAFHLLMRARDRARSTGEVLVRARAAAHAARLCRGVDGGRAELLAREAAAALAAVRLPGVAPEDVVVRGLGTRLAQEIAMNDTEPRTGAGSAEDAIPLDVFRAFVALNRLVHRENDRERLLRTLLEHAVHLTGARRGHLLLLSQGRVVERESYGQEDDGPAALSLGIVLDAIRQGRPLLTANASEDQRFAGRRSIEDYDLRSVLCAPFRAPLGQDGVLYVDNPIREGIFTTRSIDLLEALAEQVAVALGRFATTSSPARSTDPRGPGVDASTRHEPLKWVGDSAALRDVKEVVKRLAPADVPVLITGESGTGKELVARALHEQGSRRAGPFVAVNCSAVPENLLEAEFFGYVRGAFTGADHDHAGYFEQSEGGTLFLDEIGDMPAAVQAKLLRALQDGAIRPVGGLETVQTDVRLVCATNHDLDQLVESGSFRRDLLYRIRVGTVRTPPLRERPDDVPLLAQEFLRRQNDAAGTDKEFAPEALAELCAHPWPGNVRELENEVARLFLLSDGELLTRDAFLEGIEGRRRSVGSAVVDLKPMAEIEKDAIRLALQRARGNRERAAKLLGIPRATFYARVKKHGL